MRRSELRKLKVGDRIKFKTWTRDGNHTGERNIVEISEFFGIGVRFNGWNPFWLKNEEIIKKVE